MNKKLRLRRTAALAMSAALLLGSLPVYAVDDGVKPTCDEAYYATTDYYGSLTEGSVVKSYATNGIATLTDYGEYDEIVNLTDGTQPIVSGGKSTFTFDEGNIPAHFYFEGKTAKPFEELPWTLAVHYSLNGVATRAEELAGATGVVEITVDAIPNENASEYAGNNYTLEAMAVFNQDDILSLEAPGAQVQLIGNLRAVLFIGLPGEECHFTIRVGSDDFSFGGMTFLMVPATLSQLEEIAKLSARKDDLEENYDKLSSSLDVLLDSMNGISGSLYATANGLDELNEARDTISTGKAEVYEKADLVRGDLDALNEALSTLPEHIDSASQLADDTNKALGEVNDALREVQTALENVRDEAEDLCDDLSSIRSAGKATASDLQKLGRRVDSLKSKMDGLLEKIAALSIKVGTQEITMQGMTAEEISKSLKKAESMEQIYRAVGSGAKLSKEQFLLGAMIADGSTAADAQSTLTTYRETTAQIEEVRAQMGTQTESDVDFDAAEAYFFDTLVKGQYMQAGMEEAAASAAATQKKNEYDTGRTQILSLEAVFTNFNTGDKMSEEQFFAALIKLNDNSVSNDTAKTQAKLLLTLLEQSKNLTDSATALCDLLGTKGLSGHTAKLLTETGSALVRLENTADEVDDLLASLDDALDAVDDLHDILDKNLPELKSTLTDTKTTVTSLSTLLTDTNDFLGAFESLLKTSGTQLDTGTKDTLEGLAAALRATARSLNTTGDVKIAKNNISSIIEDTWNEYTGDTNNLLLMDATAEAVSLTDARNDAPQSIQVLIRTQEIKADEGAKAELSAKEAVQTTFFERVAQMFRDFLAAITGIFKGKD